MFGVCLRYSNCYDDAQDVLQDGFVKVFQKIHQFQFRGAFEGWIRRIMINTAMEKYRNQYHVISINDHLQIADRPETDEVTGSLSADELLKLVQQLSPRYRMIFNLYAIEGYSHKEIANMLNISEGTSKSNLSRARSILQGKVKIYYNESLRMND